MKTFIRSLLAFIAFFVAPVKGADYPELVFGKKKLEAYCADMTKVITITFSQQNGWVPLGAVTNEVSMDFPTLQEKCRLWVRDLAKQAFKDQKFDPNQTVDVFVGGSGWSQYNTVYLDLNNFYATRDSLGNYRVPPTLLFGKEFSTADFVPFRSGVGITRAVLDAVVRDTGMETHHDTNIDPNQFGPCWIISDVLYVNRANLLNDYKNTVITLWFGDGTKKTYTSPEPILPRLIMKSDGKLWVTDIDVGVFVIVESSKDFSSWEYVKELYYDGENGLIDTTPSDTPTFYRLNPYWQ